MKEARDRLRYAYRIAAMCSDDPHTKNGAILVNKDGGVIGIGATGFPDRVAQTTDRFERPKKYSFMEHAERRAIYAAARQGESTAGGTLYCPWYACAECARAIIDAGIARVIGHKQMFDRTHGPWKETVAYGHEMMREAGVETLQYNGRIDGCISLINGEFWEP